MLRHRNKDSMRYKLSIIKNRMDNQTTKEEDYIRTFNQSLKFRYNIYKTIMSILRRMFNCIGEMI